MPARSDNDVIFTQAVIPGAPATPILFLGDSDFRSEELLAYEVGFRFQPAETVSFDLATFLNQYDHLQTAEPVSPTTFEIGNEAGGRAYGFEITATWQATPGVTLQGWYALLRMNLEADGDSGDPDPEAAEGKSPRNQAYLRASLDLLEDVEVDVVGRYVDVLPASGVDSYGELDLRIGWHLRPGLEVALVGQNLLHDEHPESGPTSLQEQPTGVERGIYASLTWRF
jgi:iron complex outermembrane receptor protein